ncbi:MULTISPECIES: endonuclease domain-containing protein [unclassified Thermoactinomyces]|jgi:very-short-patch-repair endonuclease|uniref:endonuclease domain-containing protein n=1 Tax=unclassified Thermoactinomyces TaxID=2634588 RepID=UPI0018DE2C4A|nr:MULTISPECIES: DUF559 domain-containing protein [unclassified Thermoactinomyces]MBH8597295.1 DUF559 domain-containing protein [Thermoactinomyces sp. CICC 10523]MBH8602856.1 DUF559 domain-containing protein [Thermoactinomyces sp. CICC 10522]
MNDNGLYRFRSYLQENIRIRQKKRYKQIQQLSHSQAFIRSIVMAVESWILGEKIQWDFQYAKTQSPIERKVYNALKNQYTLKTQVPCGKYFIDIAIPKYRIAIETDGHDYHSSYQQRAHDRRKDQFLESRGWKVLRFTGSQVNGRLRWVLAQVHKAVEAYQPPWYQRWFQWLWRKIKRARS